MKPLSLLVLCDCRRDVARTVADHATAFLKYSRHRVYYFNPVGVRKPRWLDLSGFDVILIHYSVTVLWNYYLDLTWRRAIGQARALKVQFIQDEYRRVNTIHERLRELDVRLLFTLATPDIAVRIYPPEKLPGLSLVTTLAGYVPAYLEKIPLERDRRRRLDIGYRARGEGFWWLGSLFQDKARIGREFMQRAPPRGLRCDISSSEKDRLYGRKWVRFLLDCRCTLGSESGASVVDFTGEIEDQVKRYCSENPGASFEEVKDLFFSDVDGTIVYRGFSPRSFEAAACGCGLVFFEGDYFGILEPHVHYIPLQRDLENFDEVCEKIKDPRLVWKTVQRAHKHLIASGRFSYRAFCEAADRRIEEAWLELRDKPRTAPAPPSSRASGPEEAEEPRGFAPPSGPREPASLRHPVRAAGALLEVLRLKPLAVALWRRAARLVHSSPFHVWQKARLRLRALFRAR